MPFLKKFAKTGAKMPKRTYLDANVLIAAFRSDEDTAMRAMAVIEDQERQFISSALVRLETLPKPRFHRKTDEVAFIETVLAACHETITIDEHILSQAESLASKYDLSPMDALHASTAIHAHVDEFVTLEKPEKPLCHISGLAVLSLYHQPKSA